MMESRLPKLNFQFKVPARTVTMNSVTSYGSSNTADVANTKTKPTQAASRSIKAPTLTAKTADENKAPLTRSRIGASAATTTTTTNNTRTTVTRGVQKRPGLSNNTTSEPKRANLRTTMKPSVRTVRPTANTVGPVAKTISSSVGTKPSGPKPNKWDYKGRFEYTNKEFIELKQKYKELTTEYNNFQKEIDGLRESENFNRSKAEELQKMENLLKNEIDTLKRKVDKLQVENDLMNENLKQTREELDKTAFKLKECEEKMKTSSDLIADQKKEILELSEKLEDKIKTNKDLEILVQDLDRERRNLHNTIQEMKGNIRVFCRVRPKIPKEASKNLCTINYLDECTLEVGKVDDTTKMKAQRQEFSFDKVFSPNATQADIFEELSMLVQSALEGYNVCVFAYGQTGSGKTYTMEGIPGTEQEGMIPRTVKHIFREMKHFELLGWEYKIEASFLEIYNEQIVDLLDNNRKSHEIRMVDSKGHDLYVSNLLVQEINSPEELYQCLLIAQQNRAMAATQSNERSSRSHSVARIRLIGTHKSKQEVSIGNLNLVDLAGSERLKNEEAARVAETKNINKSLANLGHVILALLQKQDHIPYRNSKLTHLLMPSLGGNSKTLMLLNISPLEDSYGETVNSLRFGSNVNNCKTGTVKKVKTTL